MTPPTAEDLNTLRCHAHEIIVELYEHKDKAALILLQLHCERALEELDRLAPTGTGKEGEE